MENTGRFSGKTVFITGASRGIGKAIALKLAKDGANIIIAAKTAEAHPKLPGTIYTAYKEIEDAGGKALACVVDVRDEKSIQNAVNEGVSKFGGIDIVINNASAIQLGDTENIQMKYYDLMQNVNARGTFLVTKLCLPHLKKSLHPHVLNIAPPLNMKPHWFSAHVAYTIAKYGMSMCVLGMHDEFRPFGIAVNALWPLTTIHTAAIEMLSGDHGRKLSRKADIMADAAYAILLQNPKECTGNFFLDEEVLRNKGITDFKHYACEPENEQILNMDLFIDEEDLLFLPSKSKL